MLFKKQIDLIAKVLLVICVIPLNASAQNSKPNNLITQLCLQGFKAEMDNAGKVAPTGMGDFTCECFIKAVEEGFSIKSAQNICKKKASEKFFDSTQL